MDRQGVTDNDDRAMIAAICMGESNMVGHSETGYAHTHNDRIRKVFGERVSGLTDEQLDEIKADDRKWFNYVYGIGTRTGNMLGNVNAEDGYTFRGRGIIQLTGRGNYHKYGDDIGHPELVDKPELANDPEIAAELVVAYIDDRYKGGGFQAMMKCVGNNTPDIAERKRDFYAQFKETGEFDYIAPVVAQAATLPSPVGDSLVQRVEHAAQRAVQDWFSEL